jgi:uncharacterized protein YlxW (UPF0749 family)
MIRKIILAILLAMPITVYADGDFLLGAVVGASMVNASNEESKHTETQDRLDMEICKTMPDVQKCLLDLKEKIEKRDEQKERIGLIVLAVLFAGVIILVIFLRGL